MPIIEKGTPHCRLSVVRALVEAGKVRSTYSALSGAAALGFDFDAMLDLVKALTTADFYKSMTFKNAVSHIDDKFGVDIDDLIKVDDILPSSMKEKYSILLKRSEAEVQENAMHIGYLKISKIK